MEGICKDDGDVYTAVDGFNYRGIGENMTSQIRTEYTMTLNSRAGCSKDAFDNQKNFIEDLQVLASSMCGGCTYGILTGVWRSDAEEYVGLYYGPMEVEQVVRFQVDCEEHRHEYIIEEMRRGISINSKRFEMDINWVHVVHYPINTDHFSVERETNG